MKKLIVLLTVLVAGLSLNQLAVAKGIQSSSTSPVVMTQVNINTAGAKEIAQVLTGIGSKKAEAIVAYRTSHGVFKSVEELAAVKGIGVATIERNHSKILLK